MNDPIDILEIAASRYVKALEWWRATQQMNYSQTTMVTSIKAASALDVARADLATTERLILDLSATA